MEMKYVPNLRQVQKRGLLPTSRRGSYRSLLDDHVTVQARPGQTSCCLVFHSLEAVKRLRHIEAWRSACRISLRCRTRWGKVRSQPCVSAPCDVLCADTQALYPRLSPMNPCRSPLLPTLYPPRARSGRKRRQEWERQAERGSAPCLLPRSGDLKVGPRTTSAPLAAPRSSVIEADETDMRLLHKTLRSQGLAPRAPQAEFACLSLLSAAATRGPSPPAVSAVSGVRSGVTGAGEHASLEGCGFDWLVADCERWSGQGSASGSSSHSRTSPSPPPCGFEFSEECCVEPQAQDEEGNRRKRSRATPSWPSMAAVHRLCGLLRGMAAGEDEGEGDDSTPGIGMRASVFAEADSTACEQAWRKELARQALREAERAELAQEIVKTKSWPSMPRPSRPVPTPATALATPASARPGTDKLRTLPPATGSRAKPLPPVPVVDWDREGQRPVAVECKTKTVSSADGVLPSQSI